VWAALVSQAAAPSTKHQAASLINKQASRCQLGHPPDTCAY
jgi:hypothetical protein